MHISTTIRDLRAVKQQTAESEREFDTRLNRAVSRCGNVHIISLFTDGLSPATLSKAANYRKTHQRLTYLEVMDYAFAEGGEIRESTLKPTATKLTVLMTQQYYVHPSSSLNLDPFARQAPWHSDSLNLLSYRQWLPGVASSTILSMETQADSSLVSYRHESNQRKLVKGRAVSGLDPRQRSKWIDPQGTHHAPTPRPSNNLTYFDWYQQKPLVRGMRPPVTENAASKWRLRSFCLLTKGYL